MALSLQSIILVTSVSKSRASYLIRQIDSPSSSQHYAQVDSNRASTPETNPADSPSSHLETLSVQPIAPAKLVLRTPQSYGAEFREVRSRLLGSGTIIQKSLKAARPYAAIFGDSYCELMLPFLDSVERELRPDAKDSKKRILQFLYFSSSGCPPILSEELAISNYGPPGSNADQERKCKLHAKTSVDEMKQNRARSVILVSRWQDYMLKGTIYANPKIPAPLLPLNDAMTRITSALKETEPFTDHIVILGMIPHPNQPVLSCLWKHVEGTGVVDGVETYCPKEFPLSPHQLAWNNDFKQYLASNHPNVKYIDVMGESGLCRTIEDGSMMCKAWDEARGPMHVDPRGHLTYEGGALVTSGLAP